MKIVFMGTPEFAVPSLDILLENEFDIAGVITSPDRLGGRGRNQLIESAVKIYAREKGLKILQPKNLKNDEFLSELRSLNADLQLVVAFRMLPELVWNMPPLGTYNLHASLLPAYRGAAPINWAILKGETVTGLTTFKLKHEIDTGDIAYQKKIAIDYEDTAGTLHDKMKYEGAKLILKTVKSIANNDLILQKQDAAIVSKAPKIFHDTCQLDFNKNAATLYNFVRGLSPHPLSWMKLINKKLKIHAAQAIVEQHSHTPGKVLSDYKTYMLVACNDGFLKLEEVQLEGKRKMSVSDFLNGISAKMRTELTQ